MRLFLTSVALGSILFVASAHAEVLAICEPQEMANPASYGTAAVLNTIAPTNPKGAAVRSDLALWQDAKGFDVLLNWGEQGQLSLRAQGAEIMGDALGDDFIHLVVARAGAKSLEHFLFSWDEHAAGELIWTASNDSGGNGDDVVSYQMSCIKPKG